MQLTRTTTSRRSRRRIPASARLTEIIPPRLFRALCDPNRIALLARLSQCGRPCGVTELSGCCAVDLSVVSRHLATLREAGVLASTRRGKEIYYEVRADELVRTLRAIADVLERCCGGRCSPAQPTTARGRRKTTPSRPKAATGRKERR